MILNRLEHWLSADYLYALNPLQNGLRSPSAILWIALLLGLLAASRLWRERLGSLATDITGALCVLGLLGMAGQIGTRGPFSARIWVLAAAAMAVLVPVGAWLSGRRWSQPLTLFARGLALDLVPDSPHLPWRWQVSWLALHTVGLAGLAWRGDISVWAMGLIAACLGSTLLIQRRHKGQGGIGWRTETLAPLLIPYGAAVLRIFVSDILQVDTTLYHAFAYPDPWSLWFEPTIPLLIGLAWMLLTTIALLWHTQESAARQRLLTLGAAAAAVTATAWLGALFWRHVSHGASASDPFCYLQMAADLAHTGTPRHFFSLAALAQRAEIPTWPVVPVGYHPPVNGWAATVWPIGWPLLLAPFYRLGGETLALWAAPLFLLLSGWLLYRLAALLLAQFEPHETLLGSVVAVGVLLTSYEALSRSLVPMADASVAALSVLFLYLLIRARREDALRWSTLAAMILALIYFIRHPQLPLALAALPAFWLTPWPLRRKLQHGLLFGAVALAGAVPDLVYHAVAFGSPWISESPEWFLISPRFVTEAFGRILGRGLLRRNEFGYLWGLAGYDLARQLLNPDERDDALILLGGFVGVLLFHLFYQALRFRDLIGLFPWLALWTGRGVIGLWRLVNRARSTRPQKQLILRSAMLFLVISSLMARSARTLQLPWQEHMATFGYVTAAEREGYAQLDAMLPASAVVGTSLNAGAVTRYTGRDTVRPAAWTLDAFDRFVDSLSAKGRSLFLLADGEQMAAWLPDVALRYDLVCRGPMNVPLYGLDGQPMDGIATLYELVMRE